ncbi:MAG: DUF4277 domain-containing protein [Leptolyngbya sp. SIOISBB]|nr:DUF4277 domain-containing protein [Leptolyngbya sp. SIOISBB]
MAIQAMLLNGVGWVSAPLYWFEPFFVGTAMGAGLTAEQLKDAR